MPSLSQPGLLGLPLPTGQYNNLLEIKVYLQAHAGQNRYAIIVQKSTLKVGSWVCSKSSKYNNKGKSSTVHKSKYRENTSTTKTEYLFRVQAALDSKSKFITVVVNPDYNYNTVVLLSVLLYYRLGTIIPEKQLKVFNIAQLGYSPTAILNTLQYTNPDSFLVLQNIYNILYKLRLDKLARSIPVE
jgi:hypothetical protein